MAFLFEKVLVKSCLCDLCKKNTLMTVHYPYPVLKVMTENSTPAGFLSFSTGTLSEAPNIDTFCLSRKYGDRGDTLRKSGSATSLPQLRHNTELWWCSYSSSEAFTRVNSDKINVGKRAAVNFMFRSMILDAQITIHNYLNR